MNVSRLHIKIGDKTLVDIAFEISSSLALVGQSGSGKSLSIKALLGMLPSNMSVDIRCDSDFRLIAGESVAFVPQNPFTALSPLTKIKKQFFTPQDEVKNIFTQVGLGEELLDRFPPELSGGQLQRVVIAMALCIKPRLILLDEPTTALDPATREIILELLDSLRKEYGFKILFVTHDMASAKILCEDICVIKEGLVVERAKMDELIRNPQNEYTKTLIEASFANRKFRE